MAEINDEDDQLVVVHGVDDPIVPDADPQEAMSARQGLDPSRARFIGECSQGFSNAFLDGLVELAD